MSYFPTKEKSFECLQPLFELWELSEITIGIINDFYYFEFGEFTRLQHATEELKFSKLGTNHWKVKLQEKQVDAHKLKTMHWAVLDPPIHVPSLEGALVFHMRFFYGLNAEFGFLPATFKMSQRDGFYVPRYCIHNNHAESTTLRNKARFHIVLTKECVYFAKADWSGHLKPPVPYLPTNELLAFAIGVHFNGRLEAHLLGIERKNDAWKQEFLYNTFR